MRYWWFVTTYLYCPLLLNYDHIDVSPTESCGIGPHFWKNTLLLSLILFTIKLSVSLQRQFPLIKTKALPDLSEIRSSLFCYLHWALLIISNILSVGLFFFSKSTGIVIDLDLIHGFLTAFENHWTPSERKRDLTLWRWLYNVGEENMNRD